MTDTWDEAAARRRKFDQIVAAQAADAARMASLPKIDAARAARRPLIVGILGAFLAGGSVEAFRSETQTWAVQSPERLFGGISGAGFLNALVSRSPDPAELATILRDVLRVPVTRAQAEAAVERLAGYAAAVKQGPNPAPRHSIFFCSFLWQQQDETVPCAWPSAVRSMKSLAWLDDGHTPGAEYGAYAASIDALGMPAPAAEHALAWFDEHPWVGLDPGLFDRIRRATTIGDARVDGRYVDAADEAEAERHARQLVAEFALLGTAVARAVGDAVGFAVTVNRPSLLFGPGCFRNDTWVQWTVRSPQTKSAVLGALIAWATPSGVIFGVNRPPREPGRAEAIAARLLELPIADVHLYRVTTGSDRVERPPVSTPVGSWVFGRWFPGSDALDRQSFADDIVRLSAELQPAMDVVCAYASDDDLAPDDRGPDDASGPEADGRLAALVERFRAETGYPTRADEAQVAARAAMAASLTPEQLEIGDVAGLRRVFSSSRYGSPGPQSVLNATLRDADPGALSAIFGKIARLLHGEEPFEARIDALLAADEAVRGLGEAGMMKFLAVVYPERFIPVYPYQGPAGKARLLQAVGLPPLPAGLSRGELQVRSNDLLRATVGPLFPGDPWGMMTFLYWLANQGGLDAVPVEQPDPLPALAERLLVGEAFLRDVVGLLEDKGQVVFYGPPGTGKTFVARELAATLADDDPSRWMVVQFHPSTSYEDFFEGYRPEEGDGGALTYRLTPGPLAVLAERAAANPSREYVLVIDEINRANLPKVFGELLFLLEYRNEEIRTLYRGDEPFVLPRNVKVIGTMNTVDRSIALVDAALRRRFHFVPFFPNDGEMAGLLGRWFAANHPDAAWIADLVDEVNSKLATTLGGNDLQIGPSYFMSKHIDADGLRRVWRYSIEPLIADVLYGRPRDIAEFEFAKVYADFRPGAPGAEPVVPDGPAGG